VNSNPFARAQVTRDATKTNFLRNVDVTTSMF